MKASTPFTPDDWESAWIEAVARDDEWVWQAHMARVYSDLLARWCSVAAGGVALKTDLFEEATGHYGLLTSLSQVAEQVVGFDRAPAIVRAAGCGHQRAAADLLVAADVRALPFAPGSFHLVLSNSTLDHFSERDDIFVSLSELGRVIRPGGVLILSLDNPHNPAIRLRNLLPNPWLRRLGLVPYYMGVTLTLNQARDALARAGFVVTHGAAIVHAPRMPAIWLARRFARRPRVANRLVRLLAVCERAEAWPTRYCTGYYIALRAVRC